MSLWLSQLSVLVIVLAGGPFLWGLAQVQKAHRQGRHGPSVWQMYWVIAKNWRKETVRPEYSSWVILLTPSVSAGVMVTVLIMIPWVGQLPRAWPNNLLVIFFLLALERFWTSLAGIDSAGSFGGLGASRVAILGTGIEPVLLATFGMVWPLTGHTAIQPISHLLGPQPYGPLAWMAAVLSFTLLALAELGRLPIDNPDTHLELTMIHEATVLELNGRLLALTQWAMTLKMTVIVALGWVIFGPEATRMWINGALRIGELAGTAALLGILESRLVKLRYFTLPTYWVIAAGIGFLAFYLEIGGVSL